MAFVLRMQGQQSLFHMILCIYISLLFLLNRSFSQAQECEGDSSTCSSPQGSSICHLDASICTVPSSIYGSGGSAVAYVPNLPITSNVVCDASRLSSVPYKVAKWPWRRSSLTRKSKPAHASVAPTLEIKINLFSCQSSTAKEGASSCCCQKLYLPDSLQVDFWQARPDGRYGSIGAAVHNNAPECRTRVIVPPLAHSVVVTTVAPGSTGSLYGLGPNGWDFVPYGAPVIHVLVQPSSSSANGTSSVAPMLLDIPVVIQSSSLQPGRFFGSDLRGGAWIKPSRSKLPVYNITSWKAQPKENHITMELDLFLPQQPSAVGKRAPSTFRTIASSVSTLLPFSQEAASRRRTSPLDESEAALLCPSSLYGGPSSFFFEPIALCAPSLLDYFDL